MVFKKGFVFFSPRKRTPVVGIGKAAQPGLVSVIYCGSPHPCHLDRNSLAHDCVVDALLCCLCPDMLCASDDMVRPCQESRMVMVGQFVHRHLQGRSEHTCHEVAHRADKIVGVAPQVGAALITVLLHTGKKPGERLHKRIIIHNTVPLVSL